MGKLTDQAVDRAVQAYKDRQLKARRQIKAKQRQAQNSDRAPSAYIYNPSSAKKESKPLLSEGFPSLPLSESTQPNPQIASNPPSQTPKKTRRKPGKPRPTGFDPDLALKPALSHADIAKHVPNTPITSEFVDALSEEFKRMGFQSACRLANVNPEAMRMYLVRHPEDARKVLRARDEYRRNRIIVLEKPGNGSGANALVKGNQCILAALDKRFQPRQRIEHTGTVQHVHQQHVMPAIDPADYRVLDDSTPDSPSKALPGQVLLDQIDDEHDEVESLTLDMPRAYNTHGGDNSAPKGMEP